MIKVYMIEGNSFIDDEAVCTIEEWSKEAIIALLSDYFQDIKDNVKMGYYDSDILYIQDTFDMINDNMAQIVADSSDGGMIYIVRIP